MKKKRGLQMFCRYLALVSLGVALLGCVPFESKTPERIDESTREIVQKESIYGAPSSEEYVRDCKPDAMLTLVGQKATALEAISPLPDDLRIQRPSFLYTQDYLPKRLNVVLDEKDTITRVYCG